MRKRFWSISAKLRITIFLCCLLLLLSVTFILNVFYRDLLVNNTIRQLEYEDEILSHTIENRVTTTNSSCNTIIVHLNNAQLRLDDDKYPLLSTQNQKTIYQCMINTFSMYHGAVQVSIVWNNGVCFYQSSSENYVMYADEADLLRELDALPITRMGYWLTSIQGDFPIGGEGLYFTKPYVDIDTGKALGYIIIKMENIFDVLDISSVYRFFYLFDPNGLLIQTTRQEADETVRASEDYQVRLAQSRWLLEELESEAPGANSFQNTVYTGKGWALISTSDLRAINGNVNTTIVSIGLISFLILAVMYAALNLVIYHVTTPIKKLSQHMVSFNSELPSVFTTYRPSNDEIKVLIDHFNKMSERNTGLVERLLDEKRQQKHLELALLQSQIKPHFLYNTLDTIYCLTCIGRHEEAGKTTKLLSDYYRHALSRGMEEVLLDEELGALAKYLEIQTIRYRHVLSYCFEISPGLPALKLPKLTLQPLVENAIYHGIKPSGRPGNVWVCAAYSDGFVELRVEDDGMGMGEERFGQYLRGENTGESGFGLRNVAERLRLYFGDACTMELEPRQTGTTVCIRISVTERDCDV